MRKNRYGLYGYVSADYPGQAKCVLAWQVLDGADLSQVGSAAPRRAGIQMRVCDARAQPAELIAAFDSLRLDL
ncbi:cellulose biosynthesis protein BcsN [Skermanella pratensis]|uniref:cellulose biosynthesis protein BcsN n=1 Tax=Skermanella pratensis TaxID=2233999 RepID=UPI001FEC88D7|nr:cellulose biosynthesis protein BcsN [Skermanella pratensis]